MFKIDVSQIDEYEDHLKTFARRALPFATKNTVNGMAFAAQKAAKENIRNQMIERNRFTAQSVRVEQTRTLRINQQVALTGSIAPYMEDQEFGTVKSSSGKEGVPIATSFAAGQGEGVQPRTRLVRKPNRLANIRLQRKQRRARTRKQALLFKVQNAVQSGRRDFFHDFGSGRKAGIFRVKGGSRTFKRGWPKGAKLKMLYDMSRRSVVIPKNPWLKPAADTAQKLGPSLYIKSLQFQLERLGLFRD